jgi:hypothetical protein
LCECVAAVELLEVLHVATCVGVADSWGFGHDVLSVG